MVGSRQPQSAVAGHPLPANQNILECLVQGMSHVQLAGNVRRGNDDGIRFLLRIHMGSKAAAVIPHLINAVFKIFWLVGFCQFLFHIFNSFLPMACSVAGCAWCSTQNGRKKTPRQSFPLLRANEIKSVLPPEFGESENSPRSCYPDSVKRITAQ